MIAEWTTQLYNTADLIFNVPFGHKHWLSRHHELLTVAVCFPYLHREPWELKGLPLMGQMAGELSRLLHEDSSTGGGGIFCHNFLDCQRNLTRSRFISCASCYQADGDLVFLVNHLLSNASIKYRRHKYNMEHFLTARVGD
eukprot:4088885-Ditylum_brightwellii.AAC.1